MTPAVGTAPAGPDRRVLAGLYVLALAVRLWAALADPATPAKDAAEYHRLAVRLASGRGYVDDRGEPTAFRPPGLPLLLAGAYRVAGPDPAAGRVVLAALGAAQAPLAGLLAARVGGARAGILAAAAAALYPPFVTSWFSPRALLAEMPLASLAALCLVLALSARAALGAGEGRRSLALAGAAGLAGGAAALTKGTVLFLVALVGPALALAPASPSRRLRAAAAALVGFALVLAPWTLRNGLRFGAFVPVSTNGGISLWASYNPASRGLGNAGEGYHAAVAQDDRLRREGKGEVERSRHFAALARAEIAARPGRAARLVARKALLFFDPTLKDWSREDPPLAYNWAYGLALPFAALGAVVSLRGEARAARRLLLGFVLTLAALHVLLHTDVRYRAALEPELLALAAAGTVHLAGRIGAGGAIAVVVGWGALQTAIAWSYPGVFAALSALVRAAGLG